jgi:hypothetical protein
MNADGTNLTQLTDGSGSDLYPNWSPDGAQITFRSARDWTDGVFNGYIMNANGTNQHRLTTGSVWTFNDMTWKPDSSRVTYETTTDTYPTYEIWTIKPDGTGAARLTHNDTDDTNPVWSPDGNKIAYIANRDGNSEIYVMNTDGSGDTRITTTSFSEGNPQWQPIIGSTVESGDNNVFTVASDSIHPVLDYTVESQETLVLNGQLCDVTVADGATLKGTGQACAVVVQTGGTINPGNSPGCLQSSDMTLSGTYTAELAGTLACSSYDQLQVTGTVTISGPLNITLLNSFKPTTGDVFTIITNDDTDPVSGTFSGLAEGGVVTVGSNRFSISYVGGTGNDVVLTALEPLAPATPLLPNTGADPSTSELPLMLLASSLALLAFGLTKLRRANTLNR